MESSLEAHLELHAEDAGTIDEVKQLQLCKLAGLDFVTTNKPVEALKIMAGEQEYQ